MRRRLFIIATFLLVAVGFTLKSFAAKPDAAPTAPNQIGVVQCGETVTIYENHAPVSNNVSFMVTVTVSDFCGGLDSRLTGIKRSQDDPPINVTVPDGSTTTASFAIRNVFSGGKIELECIGDSGEGFCIYKIEDIQWIEF